ncbi:PAS domain-containing hybrid sensor histidine kinase/response regulator [Phaeobacter sp. HF9A]|uniref:PAS domain-containing hybrid sensor histidine kinase/response regulator n=1 Tax=Phaeobacter sp. HF9A TaxID=2721561 RepID=UPI0020CA91B9|nr:PAS domain-containing hybrid sensor histidine kinase/response regulator [Phaeobacter sp. HF9A]
MRIGLACTAVLCVSLVVTLPLALVMLAFYLLSDCGEVWYLRALATRLREGASVRRAQLVTMGFAILNALSVSAFAYAPMLHPHAGAAGHLAMGEPFFALCVLLGPALHAGLDYRWNPGSSLVRFLVFALLALTIGAQIIASPALLDADLILLGIGLLCFVIVLVWFLIFIQKTHQHSRRSKRSQALQRQALEDAYLRLFKQKQEARHLAMIAEHANDGVMLLHPDGTIRWVNEAYARMVGYRREELLGHHPKNLLNDDNTDPDTLRIIEDGRRDGKPFRVEIRAKRKDGTPIWVDANQVPMFDDNGQIEAFISVERDVTAAKDHERQLREARCAAEEGARIKEEFLATMSHEFRTPMNGVIGMAQMLQATNLNEDQKLYTDTILSSSRALLSLINDVLDLSRMNAAGVSLFEVDFDLYACVEDTARLLQAQVDEKGLKLTVDFAPDLPQWVRSDDRRLRQILLNLVGNAVKFTISGGIVIRVLTETVQQSLTLKIEVEDTGIGIPNNKLEHIFERFSQADNAISRRFGGTGLGLSISRGLAQAMGGDISVTSTPGQGSCFTVQLPLELSDEPALAPCAEDSCSSLEDLAGLEGLRLLVAEDNRVNRLLISKFLTDVPIDLRFAANGSEAIDLAKQFSPQVILMDMSMPEVNGLDATRSNRKLDIHQPYIAALTANVDEASHKACLDAGMDTFLSKPLSRGELLTLLLRFSKASQMSAQS